MKASRRVISALGCLLALLAACAPRNAGFQSLQAELEQRAALDVRWNSLASGALPDTAVRSLLDQPLGADAAVRIALLNNSGLQALFEDLGIARGRLVGAGLPPNVILEGGAASVGGAGRRDYGFAATADLSRLMFLPLRRGVAAAELDATRVRTTGEVLEFAHFVRNAFYDYQAATQLLELDLTVVETAAAAYDVAERLAEAGNITPLELANEQAFYEEARNQALVAEARALNLREQLNALMGLTGNDTAWELAGRLGEPADTPPDTDTLEDDAVRQSLDLLELEHRYAAAAGHANLARAEGLVPSLGTGIEIVREGGLREVGPAFSLELPLFDRRQGDVAVARAGMRQIEQRYRDQAVRVRASVRTARNEVLIATRRVEHYRDVLLPLRERIVGETQLEYNAMQLGVFQLILARREQIRTGQEYVLALRDYWRARSTLDQVMAGRLVGVDSDLGTMVWGLER